MTVKCCLYSTSNLTFLTNLNSNGALNMVVLTTFTQPTEGIRHRQPNTTVYVNDNNLGKGTLFVAESNLSWISDSGNGFSLEYPHISLHAISRDLTAFPQECLFLMLDAAVGDDGSNGYEEDNEDNENGSEEETTEIRLVPDDRGMLDAMFHAMNACQALHPDPEDSFSDEDFYEDADDETPISETGSRMANLTMRNTVGGREVDRVVGMGGDTGVGNVLDNRGVGILGGREVDRVVGILGGMVEGRADMVLDGRSFFGGNRQHQNRLAQSPSGQQSHMDFEDSTDFDDVED